MSDPAVIIGLSAVVLAAEHHGPRVLLTGSDGWQGSSAHDPALPFGSFDPVGHRTFEIALRDFVTAQTGFALGYVEQLYTFGDKGRDAPVAVAAHAESSARVVSVGYLALAPHLDHGARRAGTWADWYSFFPWEDRRGAAGQVALDAMLPELRAWATTGGRAARLAAAFGLDGQLWDEARVLERYELLYEAGLVPEAARDRGKPWGQAVAAGRPLASDHRRILATAIGRLRAKLKYRPVIFDLAPEAFTLSQLQDLVEAVCGVLLHKQNFRRTVEASGLVAPSGAILTDTGGRPARLFARTPVARTAAAPGLSLPLAKR
jgi:hypothetical protein